MNMLKENVSLEGKTVLVTGAAGFIGANLVRRLLSEVKDIRVVGIDSITDYYDVNIKYERLREIEALAAAGTRPDGAAAPGCCCAAGAEAATGAAAGSNGAAAPGCCCTAAGADAAGAATDCAEVSAAGAAARPDGGQTGAAARWRFVRGSIAEREIVERVFGEERPAVVVNLAAQAGVRYSITNPDSYIESNIIGFYNILEACRHHAVEHLVYASSSSVYGSNAKVPYSTEDKVDNPVSLYAATKKSNELMAHAYSKLYDIPSTGLRFFTVYGPAGRPDMAYFGFTDKLVHDFIHMGADGRIAVIQLETAPVIDTFSMADKEPVIGKLSGKAAADANDFRFQPDTGDQTLASDVIRDLFDTFRKAFPAFFPFAASMQKYSQPASAAASTSGYSSSAVGWPQRQFI